MPFTRHPLFLLFSPNLTILNYVKTLNITQITCVKVFWTSESETLKRLGVLFE